MTFRRLGLAALPFLCLAGQAVAGSLVTDGNFASLNVSHTGTGANLYAAGNSAELGAYSVGGESGTYTATLAGWTVYGENSSHYALWFNGSTATTKTALSQYDTDTNNALTGREYFRALPSGTPSGFLALDGGTGNGNGNGAEAGVYQTVDVRKGTIYKLTFNWAAAQLLTGGNSFSDDLFYSLGSNADVNTRTAAFATSCARGNACIPQGGTYGWDTVTAYFEAKTTGPQDLSFFAVGTAGNPPMALLDSVSLVAAPEPASAAIIMAGIAGLTVLQRRRGRAAR